jgi:hypothetical protein
VTALIREDGGRRGLQFEMAHQLRINSIVADDPTFGLRG